ncbi:helix-turn-helix transcriptional regulator [Amycolatopsis ultiminotia]|uniref:Helix-turn-helix transcriptional regulator n=1 Tax=Amycolatopsis ultiminotia TaxID=543629 RepID=A0ABP6X4L7_9PSEU
MGTRRTGLIRARKAVGLTQEELAELLGAGVKSVRAWETGRSEPQPYRREHYATYLHITPAELEAHLRWGSTAGSPQPSAPTEPRIPTIPAVTSGILLPVIVDGRPVALPLDSTTVAASALGPLVSTVSSQRSERATAAVPIAEWDAMSPLSRRSLLKNGIPAAALSTLGLDNVEHITRAIENPRRYMDKSVTEYFRQNLDNYKSDDGERGPSKTFPMVVGLMDLIKRISPEVKSENQRDLLQIAAEGAEFAGWLCRDRREMGESLYWHDRAMEWAQAAGDFTMQGYILFKKAQSAYDERDPRQMLTLTKAVRNGPWALPQRLQAEAVQQEARADAMLGASAHQISRKLDLAWQLLDTAGSSESSLGSHFNATLLNMQTAICYAEAGEPRRSVELYERTLKETQLSRRDYGFFLSLMANSLALSGEPDQAAKIGMISAQRASETNSRRTKDELVRVVEVLRPWRNRPAVQQLREAVSA